MSEDELVRELAERVNKLGVKIDMSIGSNIRMRWIKIIVVTRAQIELPE